MPEPKAAMSCHETEDWCHLCGTRSGWSVDIWYPDNAEHDPPAVPGPLHRGRHYIRICGPCGVRIVAESRLPVEMVPR